MADNKEGAELQPRARRGEKNKTWGTVRELAERIALDLNVPTRTATRVLFSVLDGMVLLLQERGELRIKGYATLVAKRSKPRAYRHPRTRKTVMSQDAWRVLVKLAEKLRFSPEDASPHTGV